MPGFLSQLGANAANAGVGSLISAGVGEISSLLNFNRQKELMRLSDQYQRNLISDLPSLNKSAMQSAGLSTSMMDGAFQSASSNSASTSPAGANSQGYYDSQFATTLLSNKNLQKQNELLDEQINGVKEDVRSKRLDNDVKDAEVKDKLAAMQYIYDRNSDFYPQPEDGLIVADKKPRYMSMNTYNLLRGFLFNKGNADNEESLLRESKAKFDKEILTSQSMSDDVRNALINLPFEQYKLVSKNVLQAMSTIDNIDASTNNINASTNNINASTRNIDANTRKTNSETDFFNKVKKYRIQLEKYGPSLAAANLINTLTEQQGKFIANQIQSALKPIIIRDAQGQSNNNPQNVIEKMLNGNANWKDVIRIGMPVMLNFSGALGQAASSVVIKGAK